MSTEISEELAVAAQALTDINDVTDLRGGDTVNIAVTGAVVTEVYWLVTSIDGERTPMADLKLGPGRWLTGVPLDTAAVTIERAQEGVDT